jgi:hypothetical protein
MSSPEDSSLQTSFVGSSYEIENFGMETTPAATPRPLTELTWNPHTAELKGALGDCGKPNLLQPSRLLNPRRLAARSDPAPTHDLPARTADGPLPPPARP